VVQPGHDRWLVSTVLVPKSLQRLLDAFRPCFSGSTFATFVAMSMGLIAPLARRTVCGMIAAARMGETWHHSRAHRFFATTRWSLDQVGVAMLGLVVGWLTPGGAPLVIAVDDTLFRRSGRHVHGAFWASTARGKCRAARRNCPVATRSSSRRW
jgi:DDE superfamily endonuclease